MARSKIEWLARPGTKPESWNPITGCDPVSPGCQNCYARRLAKRLKAMGQEKYRDVPKVTLHESELVRPAHWYKPRTCFVCSMSDLFHEAVTTDFIDAVFDVMRAFPEHTFIVLSKRAERLGLWHYCRGWPRNVWAGVTVEHPDYLWRLDSLRRVRASTRFVSFEPLLGTFKDWRSARPDLSGSDWTIVGAETGPGKRHMDESAASMIAHFAGHRGIPFFFKKNNDGSRLLDGRIYEEWPCPD